MKERIREARKALGLSQEKFAEGLGYKSAGKVQNVEYGRIEIDDAFVRLICEVYKINYDWITTGNGAMFWAPDNLNGQTSEPSKYALKHLSKTLPMLDDFQCGIIVGMSERMISESNHQSGKNNEYRKLLGIADKEPDKDDVVQELKILLSNNAFNKEELAELSALFVDALSRI